MAMSVHVRLPEGDKSGKIWGPIPRPKKTHDRSQQREVIPFSPFDHLKSRHLSWSMSYIA